MHVCLLICFSISWHPSISDHSQYSQTTLILVFLLFFFLDGPIIRHSYQMASQFWFSYLYCCYNTWFSVRNLQFIISSDPPYILSFIGLYILLNIFRSHVLNNDFFCPTNAHISQPCSLLCVCFVCFLYLFLFHNFERAWWDRFPAVILAPTSFQNHVHQ